jgi:hypothetical protein
MKAAERAARDFKRFHWDDEAREIIEATAPGVPRGAVLYQLGELVQIVYRASKAGDVFDWEHDFKTPRPALAATRAGGLVIVGGSYSVTDRGIVG